MIHDKYLARISFLFSDDERLVHMQTAVNAIVVETIQDKDKSKEILVNSRQDEVFPEGVEVKPEFSHLSAGDLALELIKEYKNVLTKHLPAHGNEMYSIVNEYPVTEETRTIVPDVHYGDAIERMVLISDKQRYKVLHVIDAEGDLVATKHNYGGPLKFFK